jgi:hypothetical protein
VHQPEAPADDDRAPEQRLHLLGTRVGGDVEILRLDAEQEVAHRAAHHVAREAGVAQHRADLGGGRGKALAREAVLFARHPQGGFGGQAQHPPDEPLDH